MIFFKSFNWNNLQQLKSSVALDNWPSDHFHDVIIEELREAIFDDVIILAKTTLVVKATEFFSFYIGYPSATKYLCYNTKYYFVRRLIETIYNNWTLVALTIYQATILMTTQCTSWEKTFRQIETKYYPWLAR